MYYPFKIEGLCVMTTNSSSSIEEKIEDLYHIKRWGEGYFTVTSNGNLGVNPAREENQPCIDIQNVIKEITQKNIQIPVVIRFHDILRSQVKHLNESFQKKVSEAKYQGKYIGVYPIKVNQMREVVEEVLDAGEEYSFGLEAGSKPELLSVLALNDNNSSLIILNGYKDKDYLRLALLGRKLEKNTIVVIEKYSELTDLIEISKEMNIKPLIGFRTKITVRGSGKWSESGGEKAKFGLSISEVLNGFELLKKEEMLDCLQLLHFHVGSQITNIRTVKDSISEGARVYCELYKMGAHLKYIDVGGGLGVDYDGSQSTGDSSRNYDVEIYASDIIYSIMQICDLEKIPHPDIVSESGRAITAHHSCVVVEVIDKIDSTQVAYPGAFEIQEDEHILVKNIRSIFEFINEENVQESFNDALAIKNDTENAFKLGVISIREKATIETIFWKICKHLKEKIKTMDFVPEDFENFSDRLSSQYLCNFSVFQSLPDIWAIDQLLPIVPLSKLNELPEENCTLVDITCDSDGKIDNFINLGDTKKTLQLHNFTKDENYYIGFFLTGAYQDVMGDMHNLFGRVNEVHVFLDEESEDNFYIEEVIPGSSARYVLSQMQYNPDHLAYTIKKAIDRRVAQKGISPREGVKLIDFYEDCLNGYTYLSK